MTPILGSALALVLADCRHLLRSVLLVLTGALTVVAIGFLIAYATSPPAAPSPWWARLSSWSPCR